MTGKVKNEGGRPPLQEGEKAQLITVSVSRAEREQFERDVERFADGNKSKLFRLMYNAWRAEMARLLGKAVGE